MNEPAPSPVRSRRAFRRAAALLLLLAAAARGGEPGRDERGPLLRTLVLNEMPMRDAGRFFTQGCDWPVIVSRAAADVRVSAFLKHVRCEDAMRALCRSHGLWYRQDPQSNIIEVLTMEELKQNTMLYGDEVVEVATVLYPAVVDIGDALADLFRDRVVWTPPREDSGNPLQRLDQAFERMDRLVERAQYAGDGEEESATSATVSSTRRETASTAGGYGSGRRERTAPREERDLPDSRGAVFVSALPSNNALLLRSSDPRSLEQVRQVVRELDRPVPQVLLEVKVLDVELGDDSVSGVDWLFGSDSRRTSGGASRGVERESAPWGESADWLQPPGQQISPPDGNLVPQGTGLDPRALVFNYVHEDLRARLQLLESEQKIVRLATPNLFVADNEASRVFIGMESTILKSVTIEREDVVTGPDGQTTPRITRTPETDRERIGTSLLITPRIHADRTVTIRVLQENSSLGELRTIAYGGNPEDQFLAQDVERRSVTTTVVANDNNIVAIGGLVREQVGKRETGVPVLKDVPLVGNAFKRKATTRARTEMIVLIRPIVLLAPGENDKVSLDFLERLSLHPTARKDLPDLGVGAEEDLKRLAENPLRLRLVRRLAARAPIRPLPAEALSGAARLGPEEAARLEGIRALERTGRHAEALLAYRGMEEEGLAPSLASKRFALCLLRAGKPDVALNRLGPLPRTPADWDERERLMIAGEALLRMERPEHAESVLELALGGIDPLRNLGGSLLGPAYANLGKAYLHTGKPEHARRALERARGCFAGSGDVRAARECARLAEALDRELLR